MFVNIHLSNASLGTSHQLKCHYLTGYCCVCCALLSLLSLLTLPVVGLIVAGILHVENICSVNADDEEDRELQQALWLSSQQAHPHGADPQGFRSCGNSEPGVLLTALLEMLNMAY